MIMDKISNQDTGSLFSYMKSVFLSIKHNSYFQVYDDIFSKFCGKDITFVEIGVLNGGSLFMWRDFFGPSVRIIGIDLNPEAKRWESEGFEIFIGSQSDPKFRKEFFSEVGDVDLILDDGGHTNEQQIVTTNCCIEHINNGGVLAIEDTHASYMSDFGNPSRFSFMAYAKYIVDVINSRFSGLKNYNNVFIKSVYSVHFNESFVIFNMDRNRCFSSKPTSNDGISFEAEDVRHQETALGFVNKAKSFIADRVPFLKKNSGISIGCSAYV